MTTQTKLLSFEEKDMTRDQKTDVAFEKEENMVYSRWYNLSGWALIIGVVLKVLIYSYLLLISHSSVYLLQWGVIVWQLFDVWLCIILFVQGNIIAEHPHYMMEYTEFWFIAAWVFHVLSTVGTIIIFIKSIVLWQLSNPDCTNLVFDLWPLTTADPLRCTGFLFTVSTTVSIFNILNFLINILLVAPLIYLTYIKCYKHE
jgi:hypothetical protein